MCHMRRRIHVPGYEEEDTCARRPRGATRNVRHRLSKMMHIGASCIASVPGHLQ